MFSRWLPVGNVRVDPLAEILHGPTMLKTTAALAEQFANSSHTGKPCDPQCGPNCSPACNPSCWPTGTGLCGPNGGCQPNYDK